MKDANNMMTADNISVEVLMSAMYQDNFDIAYRAEIDSDLLIINQCDKEDYQEIEVNGHKWRMISSTERGSNKSRELAVKMATGQICMFCDDDEKLAENYVEKIKNAYKELDYPAAIAFNISRKNINTPISYYVIKEPKRSSKKRGYGTAMLSIDVGQIRDADVHFSPYFGAGTEWGCGEDILFEFDIIDKGLKMYEHPTVIGEVDYSHGSTWFNGYNEKYFYNIGAFYQCVYRKNPTKYLRVIYNVFYKFRKDKKIKKSKKIQYMLKGMSGFKKKIPYDEFYKRDNERRD